MNDIIFTGLFILAALIFIFAVVLWSNGRNKVETFYKKGQKPYQGKTKLF